MAYYVWTSVVGAIGTRHGIIITKEMSFKYNNKAIVEISLCVRPSVTKPSSSHVDMNGYAVKDPKFF